MDAYLGWHVADVIYTWPERTADYAIAALRSNRHVTEGVADNIHSAALRAHTERPGPSSPQVVEVALDLMLTLQPEIREVLAHELCRSSLGSAELLDVFSAWKNDPDDRVRQTVAVGVTRVLLTESVGQEAETPQMEALRASVRQDLCSYGPNMEQNRRNAWVSMLMLGDLSLIEGLRETIGEPDEPGVDLCDIYGTPDALLVRLVADRWEELQARFGQGLLPRLAASRLRSEEESSRLPRAVQALASAAERNGAIADLVDEYVTQEEAGRLTGVPAGASLRLTIPVVEGHKRRTGGDSTSLNLVLQAADAARQHHVDRHDRVTRWALAQVLDVQSWSVSVEGIRQALASGPAESPVVLGRRALLADRAGQSQVSGQAGEPDAWNWERAWLDERFTYRRALWSLLFPQDPLTQRWLSALGAWFAQGPQRSGEPASWLEVCALCLGAAPAVDLPAIIERLFHPMRLELLGDSHWQMTVPLLHRLRHDTEAVETLRSSAGEAAVQETPLFAPGWSPDRVLHAATGPRPESEALEAAARRAFVGAMALRRTGHLEAANVAACVHAVQRVDPRTSVVDPFTNQAGPVWSAGVGLVGVV